MRSPASICSNTPSLVLLEAPFDPARRQKNSVLLAIDLTTAVADEAIQRRDSAVVAYREMSFLRVDDRCTGSLHNRHVMD